MKFKQIRNLYEGVKRQIKEVRDAFYSRRDAVIRFIETPINEEAVARFNAIVKNTDNNIDKEMYYDERAIKLLYIQLNRELFSSKELVGLYKRVIEVTQNKNMRKKLK